MDLYATYIALSRYARWIPEEGRRETWEETVERYFSFFRQRLINRGTFNKHIEKMLVKSQQFVLELKAMPSMRALMTAGPALERDEVAGYNCSYNTIGGAATSLDILTEEMKDVGFDTPIRVNLSEPHDFDEIMYILLCGTGVGFSVERQYINDLPVVGHKLPRSIYQRTNKNFPEVPRDELSTFYRKGNVIRVADSKYGWASAIRILITELYNGNFDITWNLDQIRPSGAKLKTFGGRASGPEPLARVLAFVKEVFKGANGRKLNSIECHDIVCKIAESVVVGGVRRAALISLSNLTDQRMARAKSGDWFESEPQRMLSNNSIAFTEKPDVGIFMQEWSNIYESKSGERGLFNRVASQRQAGSTGRRDASRDFGTNPCLHPDSIIETVNGRMKIKDITSPTQVYSMDKEGKLIIKPCSASWISKKDAPTINITIASGKIVRCTPDHKIFIEGRGWIEAQDIHIGDKVVHLIRNRSGAAYSGVKLTTQDSREYKMEHRLVWEAVNGPIPKGYDIHHIDGDTYNNDVDNLECLSHSDHSSITRYECENNHQVLGYRDNNPGRHGSMWGFVSGGDKKPKLIVPIPDDLKSNLHQYATVVKIEEGERTDVYDLTVEDTHNFIADFVVVHNCSEIILRPKQFCNLSEVVVRSTDTFEELRDKVRVATFLGTLQATLTNFRYLRPIWRQNTEEEALLGVSLTGIMDHPILSGQKKEWDDDNNEWFSILPEWLKAMKEEAISENAKWANIFQINRAAAISCVKPSGTVSQLVDSASGIHARHSAYYIRRVRADKKDPLGRFMADKGFPVEDAVGAEDSVSVFSFPIKAPEGAITRDEVSALEQLDHWKIYQEYWCEHKPSITVTMREQEWPEVGAWVWENFDMLSGVSFLPHSDHVYPQLPYEEISKEEYEELAAKLPTEIDWSELSAYEVEDTTTGTQEYACTSGACEIVDTGV